MHTKNSDEVAPLRNIFSPNCSAFNIKRLEKDQNILAFPESSSFTLPTLITSFKLARNAFHFIDKHCNSSLQNYHDKISAQAQESSLILTTVTVFHGKMELFYLPIHSPAQSHPKPASPYGSQINRIFFITD